MNAKKVLLLNAGYTEEPLIHELKELGYYVITTGRKPELPGHKLADEYIYADYSDKEAILKIASDNSIDGIVSCAYDSGMESAAYVAEKLGLPGHDSYENTLNISRKERFKKLCEKLDLPAPKSVYYDSIKEAKKDIVSMKFPIIVKATDQASGVGISRADNPEEAIKALEKAFECSRNNIVLAEPFIEGDQESINAFVVGGKVVQVVSCDCYSPINPYLIQTETLPARHYDEVKTVMISAIEKLFKELKLVDGIITVQYIVKEGKPYIFEAMRRCLGNRYLITAEALTGYPWHKALVMSELGLDISKLESGNAIGKYTGHHAIMSSKNGILKGLEIPDDVLEHVFQKEIVKEIGDEISNYMSERIGWLYYTYDEREELDAAASHFNKSIRIIMG